MPQSVKALWIALLLAGAPAAYAQSTDTASEDAAQTDTESDDADLLTQAELENLVAPVALYPDTLLIQILVASTYPLEVIKGDRLLAMNDGADPETMNALIEAEEWDPSVEVLATAFPDVLSDMASHVEWTETMGNAMLAQSDDVMAAVQTMRAQAVNSGALISGEEQTVEVTQDEVTQAETVVIQPTNPEVVYVPQYDPQVVYNNDNMVGDALVTGAVAFGTFALIDAIFDDDDDWNDYWGCRNCGGWGGGPIYTRPDVDIDVDGNVNIGNNVNVGNNRPERPDRNPDGSWKPDPDRQKDAKDKIAAKRDPNGKTKLPVNKKETRGDSLRTQLSNKSGAADISRPGVDNKRPQVNRPSRTPDGAKRNAINKTAKKPQVNRPKAAKPAAQRPAAKKPAAKPAVKKPAAKRPPVKQAKPHKKPKATAKRASAPKARKASSRGKASGRKAKGRR
ncbi:hypothetical protein SuNHUV7_34590 (plasmid) [Pseudoseohaeicola sp. NH-UV-7]|uniref:DUF3300 domain-containing protein n=1 Tax=Sulfitobacter sp. TBRI5 TaxID=2989732 RepID=UPI003A74EA36